MRHRKPEHQRDPRFHGRARRFLQGKVCAVCGGTERLQAHHEFPFHLFPELELAEEHWIPLCEARGHNCHLIFGHLGSFRAWNPNVRRDAAAWRRKIASRPTDVQDARRRLRGHGRGEDPRRAAA